MQSAPALCEKNRNFQNWQLAFAPFLVFKMAENVFFFLCSLFQNLRPVLRRNARIRVRIHVNSGSRQFSGSASPFDPPGLWSVHNLRNFGPETNYSLIIVSLALVDLTGRWWMSEWFSGSETLWLDIFLKKYRHDPLNMHQTCRYKYKIKIFEICFVSYFFFFTFLSKNAEF